MIVILVLQMMGTTQMDNQIVGLVVKEHHLMTQLHQHQLLVTRVVLVMDHQLLKHIIVLRLDV